MSQDVDDDPALWLLARAYFYEDWKVEEPVGESIVREFVRDEGPEAAGEAAAEVEALLDRPATEDELAQLWTRDYRSHFNPTRFGMTYRAWFERMLTILRE